MFARIVTIPLKPGRAAEFATAIQDKVIPLLRTHKGFRDQIALVTDGGKTSVGMSFWENKESAEAYSRSGFAEVMKALDKVAAGAAEVKTYEVTNSTVHKIAPALVG